VGTFIAQDLARILLARYPWQGFLLVVFVLTCDDCIQCPDGAALVPSDTPVNEFLLSVGRVEIQPLEFLSSGIGIGQFPQPTIRNSFVIRVRG